MELDSSERRTSHPETLPCGTFSGNPGSSRDHAVQKILMGLQVFSGAVAVLALTVLAVRAAVRLELRWDTFSYHLPFAAIWGNLGIPYEMNDLFSEQFQGFPPLPHLIQGVLWKLTGSVNATGVVNFLAFGSFLFFCHRFLRAPFWLVALISLTAPMVIIHTTVSYVDLFGNSFLALGAMVLVYLSLYPERASVAIWLGGLLGLAGAAWSKYLLVPLAALFFCFYFLLSFRLKNSTEPSRREGMGLLLAVALLAAAPYIKNFILYQNPFWPLRVPIASGFFPYKNPANARTERPSHLRDASQVKLFVHSLLEVNHPVRYPHRERWIIDQGTTSYAFRMGGFWKTGVVIYLVLTVSLLVFLERRRGAILVMAALGVLAFLAILPVSNELRYYMFLPLTWAGTLGILFPLLKERVPVAASGFLVAVVVLFGYMVWENRAHYRIQRVGYLEAAKFWRAAGWWPRLQSGVTYCAVDMAPAGILLTGPTMREFTIVERSRSQLCPANSVVLIGTKTSAADLRVLKQQIELSASLFNAGRYEDAVTACQKAILIEPKSVSAHTNMCAAYNAMGRWEKAMEACSDALAIDPNHQLAKNNLEWAKKESERKGP